MDSKYSHLAWIEKPRSEGGLGGLKYPLVSDLKREIAEAFNVLDAAEGVALRGLFVIDPQGVIQHSKINNLAFGRRCVASIHTHTHTYIHTYIQRARERARVRDKHMLTSKLRALSCPRRVYIYVKIGNEHSVDETLRVLQAIVHVQKHPDRVCPIGWKPGDADMVPDPVGSKAFFSSQH